MKIKEAFYPETKFGGFTDIDGTVAFYNRVNSLIDISFLVLDVGCGRGEYKDDTVFFRKNLKILRGKGSKVIGIDIDENAKNNPFIDEFKLICGNYWPVDDNSIDLIVCDNVLEHIEEPDKFFNEIRRVLKNNGFICIRTTNLWNYIALLATIIPNKYHHIVTSFAQDDRKNVDVFPTLYRCNTIGKLKRIMKKNFFECVVYGYEAEPSYHSFSNIAYFLGVLHQRFIPGLLKHSIFAFGKLTKN